MCGILKLKGSWLLAGKAFRASTSDIFKLKGEIVVFVVFFFLPCFPPGQFAGWELRHHIPGTCRAAFLCRAAASAGRLSSSCCWLSSQLCDTSRASCSKKKKKNRDVAELGRREGAILQRIPTQTQQGVRMGRSCFNINANTGSGALIMGQSLSREVVQRRKNGSQMLVVSKIHKAG